MRNRTRLSTLGVLLCAAIALSTAPVRAQRFPDENASREFAGRASVGTPGQFDYYALVLSWSPTYCAGRQADDRDPQCRPRGDRAYAFVLHGLWPQYERGYPQFCRTRERPFVPQDVIRRMADIMPSPKLTIHEYRRHGTCSGLDPGAYYDLARTMYARITIPARFLRPATHQFVNRTEIVREFAAANPMLPPDGIAVACGGPGNRLREVRICLTRQGEFRACGSNEVQRPLCRAERLHVPPVRPSAARPYEGERPRRSPLPGPLPGPIYAPPGQRSL